jgi:hypothetical protein
MSARAPRLMPDVRRLYDTTMNLAPMLYAILLAVGSAQTSPAPSAARDWTLVRSVSNEQGGTMDFVVVPVKRQRDREHYESIANAVCGPRTACMVHFWTELQHVPTSAWMSGAGLSQMTAQYERSPSYKAPVLRLACWLYATKLEAETAKCFYLPGAKMPWPQ